MFHVFSLEVVEFSLELLNTDFNGIRHQTLLMMFFLFLLFYCDLYTVRSHICWNQTGNVTSLYLFVCFFVYARR